MLATTTKRPVDWDFMGFDRIDRPGLIPEGVLPGPPNPYFEVSRSGRRGMWEVSYVETYDAGHDHFPRMDVVMKMGARPSKQWATKLANRLCRGVPVVVID